MDEIVSAAARVTGIMSEIPAASQEQAQTITQAVSTFKPPNGGNITANAGWKK